MKNSALDSVEPWWRAQCILVDAQSYCRSFGRHSANPYHNLRHCELVGKVAVFYGMEQGLERNDLVVLGLAGLFHDFNHSGEPLDVLPDRENIRRALRAFQEYSDTRCLPTEHSATVRRLMANTEVEKIDGQIRFQEPVGHLDTFLRDADVSQMLFPAGRETQVGLAREMDLPFDSRFRETAVRFLYTVRLYTEPAQRRRAALRDELETWVRDTEPFEEAEI